VAVLALLALASGRLVARGSSQGQPDDVAIDYPRDGDEVAGPGVLVQWTAPETAADGSELHVDLIADDGTIRVDRAPNPAVVPRLETGQHTITLEVQDANDQPVAGLGGASVTFTVLQPMAVRIHAGTCDDLDFDPVAALNDVESGFRTTTVAEEGEEPLPPLPLGAEDVNLVEVSETLLELPSAVLLGEDHAVVVYAPGAEYDDELEADEIAACGQIGGPLYQGTLMVGLTPLNDSESFGVATLVDERTRTRIRIEVHRGVVEPVATPSPVPTATPPPTATVPPTVPPPPTSTPVPPPPPPTNTPIPPPVFPTNTPRPPTSTPVPPTSTSVPPTNTPVPPATDTPVPPPPPTDTPVPPPPPTDTPVPPPPPTDTPVPPPPPTDTPVP
jgi:hypothetical protein